MQGRLDRHRRAIAPAGRAPLAQARKARRDHAGVVEHQGVAGTQEIGQLADDMVAAVQPFAVSGGTAAAFVPDPNAPIQPGSVSWVETFVPKASGANFAPHITIGTAPFAFVKGVAAEPFAGMDFGVRGVAIYQLGNYGTAARKLWSAAQ